jgi:hypothetical protein
MSDNNSTAIEYIKLQWEDIHHSRLQDWSYIGVIAGVIYGIVNIQTPELRLGLSLLGLLSSTLGAYMAWQHYQIFMDKLVVIAKMEQRLGIQYPSRDSFLPVQTLIFLLFAGIASTFFGMTLYFLPHNRTINFFQIYSLWGGIVAFIGVCIYVYIFRKKQRNKAPYIYDKAYFASMDKLEQCLEQLKDKPLKLIADERWTQPQFEEIPWEDSEWTILTEGDKIRKPILLNRRDLFQFSLANESSKQDWHYHKYVFEIYLSYYPITLEYRELSPQKNIQSLKVSKGIMIIPPGLPHRVTLSGTTFVFQASLAGKGLSEDKVISGK